jgi:riboflavin kinase
LTNIMLKGKVFTGNGEGKKFVALPWVQKQIQQKLGFDPYLGTLNIHLDRASLEIKKKLDKVQRLEITPEKGFCKAILIKGKMTGLDCGLVIPQVGGYPPDVLEIVAPVFLRQRLHFSDGSLAAVTVELQR